VRFIPDLSLHIHTVLEEPTIHKLTEGFAVPNRYKWDTLPGHLRPEAGLLGLRAALKVFANLRPASILPQLVDASTLKREIVEGVDIMVVRELTGGIYFGEPKVGRPHRILRHALTVLSLGVDTTRASSNGGCVCRCRVSRCVTACGTVSALTCIRSPRYAMPLSTEISQSSGHHRGACPSRIVAASSRPASAHLLKQCMRMKCLLRWRWREGLSPVTQIERIARVGFETARKRTGKLCSVDKANVLDVSRLWREVVTKMGEEEYPDVELTHMYVDNCAMQLIRNPKQFDTIVTGALVPPPPTVSVRLAGFCSNN
jgi:hypothetical protein